VEQQTRGKRRHFNSFQLPILSLRLGSFSAASFWRSKQALEKSGNQRHGALQFTHKTSNATICGIDEVLAVLRVGAGHWKDEQKKNGLAAHYRALENELQKIRYQGDWRGEQNIMAQQFAIEAQMDLLWESTYQDLQIHALYDGQTSVPHRAMLLIEGLTSDFVHLESVIMGILARNTRIATNAKQLVDAANGKPVFMFADRNDRWENQLSDGYAASISGVIGAVTEKMGEPGGLPSFDLMSHNTISMFVGDTKKSIQAVGDCFPKADLICLVDYANDCVRTSIDVARTCQAAGYKLWGVRIDTDPALVDRSISSSIMVSEKGVCPTLVKNVRQGLDSEGFQAVKIIVSGGFTPAKIKAFKDGGVPVNGYGVGQFFHSGQVTFSADIVKVAGRNLAKVGRSYRPDSNLEPFSWDEIEK
jgi:nicotinate phosphoribosyltransferase